MTVDEVLKEALYEPNYAIRYKVGGNPLIVGQDRVVWSLTKKYFKTVETSLIEKYTDWEPMLPTDSHHELIKAVTEGKSFVTFMGQEIYVMTPVESKQERVEETGRSPVTDESLTAAGKIAEALGKCIPSLISNNNSESLRLATEGMQQLIWLARNVGWETKANRHLYESKHVRPREKDSNV